MSIIQSLGSSILALLILSHGISVSIAAEFTRVNPYENLTTAPTLIQVRLVDATSGSVHNMIWENYIFAGFLEDHRSIPLDDYVSFMESNKGRAIEIDISALESWLAQFGRNNSAQTFDSAFTLAELGFESRDELLAAYFNFDQMRGGGMLLPKEKRKDDVDPWGPKFIALLNELDMIVGHSDISEVLYVHCPFFDKERIRFVCSDKKQ